MLILFTASVSIFALDKKFLKDTKGRHALGDSLRRRCEDVARGVHQLLGAGDRKG